MKTASIVALDAFYEHLSLRDKLRRQTFSAFLPPFPVNTSWVFKVAFWFSDSDFLSNSSLTHLMSHLSAVCLGCRVFHVLLCMQIHTDNRQESRETHVSHMCSEFQSLLCSTFLFFFFFLSSIFWLQFFNWLLVLCNHLWWGKKKNTGVSQIFAFHRVVLLLHVLHLHIVIYTQNMDTM